PLVVQRYIHRASIHSDGGPEAALNVTNTAASASKDNRARSAILDRLCFVIMFAPPTRECSHSPSSINACASVRFRTGRSQVSLPQGLPKSAMSHRRGAGEREANFLSNFATTVMPWARRDSGPAGKRQRSF